MDVVFIIPLMKIRYKESWLTTMISQPVLLFAVDTLLLEHTVDGAFILALLNALALVVLALASRKSDDELCQSPLVDKQPQGHNRETGLHAVPGNAADFLAVEQQLAVAVRRVVVIRAKTVLGNIHVLGPNLIIDDHAVGVGEAHLSLTDGFYLGTGEHNARSIGLDYLIVKGRLAVFDIYRILMVVVPCHSLISQTINNPNKALSTMGNPSSKTDEMTTNLATLFFFTNK